MTILEIYNEISNNHHKIPDEKLKAYQDDFRRYVLRLSSYKFPASKSYSYLTHNMNAIICTLSADKRAQHNKPYIGFHTVYSRKEGKYVVRYNPRQKKISIFAPHFFKRYQERILKDITMPRDEAIKLFVANNQGLCSIEINDEVEAVFKCFEGHYSDEKIDIAAAVNQGYCFAEIQGDVTIVKTIISEEMLSENQKKLFPSLRRSLEQSIDYLHSV